MTQLISFIYNVTWTNGDGVGTGQPPQGSPEYKDLLEVANDWRYKTVT